MLKPWLSSVPPPAEPGKVAWSPSGFAAFMARAERARGADPERVARAAENLIGGALRLRRGGDGIYGEVARPVTKPAEAIGAWVASMRQEAVGGEPFTRGAELREALVAAAEEVDQAAQGAERGPAAARLREALYRDAADLVQPRAPFLSSPYFPWVVAGVTGGTLLGVLLMIYLRRKRG